MTHLQHLSCSRCNSVFFVYSCDEEYENDEEGENDDENTVTLNEPCASDIEVVCDSSDEEDDDDDEHTVTLNGPLASDIEVVCDSSDEEDESDPNDNEFERERSARIAANKRRLHEVLKAKASFDFICPSKKKKKTYKKAKLPPPRQKSLRLAGVSTKISYDETKIEKQMLIDEKEYEKCQAYKSETLSFDWVHYGEHPELYMCSIWRPGRGRPDHYWKLFNLEGNCYLFENCDATGCYKKGVNQQVLRSHSAVERFIERAK